MISQIVLSSGPGDAGDRHFFDSLLGLSDRTHYRPPLNLAGNWLQAFPSAAHPVLGTRHV